MNQSKMTNGWEKALGGVLVIFALIAGMASIVKPMQQQITDLKDDIVILQAGHATVVKVDTQLGVFQKDLEDLEDWRAEHDLRIPWTDSGQWERIKALERSVYGKAGD